MTLHTAVILRICCFTFIELLSAYQFYLMSSTRGGRPATTISRPSHILPIFSSEPPRSSRPLSIICFKVSNSCR